MVSVVVAALALAIPIEDVTLPNGVRVIVSVDHAVQPPEVVVSRDRSVIVVVGDIDPEQARARYAAPGALPSPPPELPAELPTNSLAAVPPGIVESWQVRRGPASLVIEWQEAPPDEQLLALLSLVDGSFEREGSTLRYRVDGGWPPAERRAFDVAVERLASATPRERIAVRDRCLEWAAPRSARERAERLLQVTLATGNPRLVRDLFERCASLAERRASLFERRAKAPPPTVKSLLGRNRRVRSIIPD